MNTTLNELREWVLSYHSPINSYILLSKIEELLPKEREAMSNTWTDGYGNGVICDSDESKGFNDYFTETFKN